MNYFKISSVFKCVKLRSTLNMFHVQELEEKDDVMNGFVFKNGIRKLIIFIFKFVRL